MWDCDCNWDLIITQRLLGGISEQNASPPRFIAIHGGDPKIADGMATSNRF